jgi:hypothetical protein
MEGTAPISASRSPKPPGRQLCVPFSTSWPPNILARNGCAAISAEHKERYRTAGTARVFVADVIRRRIARCACVAGRWVGRPSVRAAASCAAAATIATPHAVVPALAAPPWHRWPRSFAGSTSCEPLRDMTSWKWAMIGMQVAGSSGHLSGRLPPWSHRADSDRDLGLGPEYSTRFGLELGGAQG